MKKSLLLGITWLTIVAFTATTLFAQTTTGTSIIDKMKAAVHAFTLWSSLGQTGLESSPILGKKTGDILTAGEWNRVLELVGEGGGGGFACPTGFTLIGAGTGLFCISTASETPTTYAGAMESCYQKNAQLCNSMEWYTACRENETSKATLQWMGGATLEMTSTASYYYNVITMGSGGGQTWAGYFINESQCETKGYVLDVRTNNAFRCCIK